MGVMGANAGARVVEADARGRRPIGENDPRQASDIRMGREHRLHALDPEPRRHEIVVEEHDAGEARAGQRQPVVTLRTGAFAPDHRCQVGPGLIEARDIG